MFSLIKQSSNEFKKISTLTATAMLTALKNVIDVFRIPVSNILEIGFTHLISGVTALYYGPVVAGVVGILSDTLGYILHPSGPYFPGFALNEFIIGFLYGLFFYKKQITLGRVVVAQLCISIITGLILTPLWLHILYGNAFFAIVSARIVAQAIKFPIDCALLYFLLKTLTRIKKA